MTECPKCWQCSPFNDYANTFIKVATSAWVTLSWLTGRKNSVSPTRLSPRHNDIHVENKLKKMIPYKIFTQKILYLSISMSFPSNLYYVCYSSWLYKCNQYDPATRSHKCGSCRFWYSVSLISNKTIVLGATVFTEFYDFGLIWFSVR